MLLESIGPDFSSVPDGAAKLLIGGRMVAAQGGRSFVSTNPATEENVASVPDAGPEDVESAMEAARNAHKAWAARSYDERRKVVLAIADRLKHFAEPLGMLDTLENGNVLSAMRACSVPVSGYARTPPGELGNPRWTGAGFGSVVALVGGVVGASGSVRVAPPASARITVTLVAHGLDRPRAQRGTGAPANTRVSWCLYPPGR